MILRVSLIDDCADSNTGYGLSSFAAPLHKTGVATGILSILFDAKPAGRRIMWHP